MEQQCANAKTDGFQIKKQKTKNYKNFKPTDATSTLLSYTSLRQSQACMVTTSSIEASKQVGQ